MHEATFSPSTFSLAIPIASDFYPVLEHTQKRPSRLPVACRIDGTLIAHLQFSADGNSSRAQIASSTPLVTTCPRSLCVPLRQACERFAASQPWGPDFPRDNGDFDHYQSGP